MKTSLAPWLALWALGVRPLEPINPTWFEVPSSIHPNNRKTGVAVSRRVAQKRKNKRRTS